MKQQTVLVTGASGFIGKWVVKALSENGVSVRAGVHDKTDDDIFNGLKEVKTVHIDILDVKSLLNAMQGTDTVYHFAAHIDSHDTFENLKAVNVEGTKNIYVCAAECGVKSVLYCSSTSVYGLLAGSSKPVSEDIKARAIEPYGYSKLMGESAALDIAKMSGLHTIIIRPVAVFGPKEKTAYGKKFRDAAISKILLAGGFHNKKFSFVYVEDVAGAALHLMNNSFESGSIFNIAYPQPINFDEAMRSYLRALKRAGKPYRRARFIAGTSSAVHKLTSLSKWMSKIGGNNFVFNIWQPGFDMSYSSDKLLQTSFRFKWNNFEEILYSCIRD